jgi:hypothetical protein
MVPATTASTPTPFPSAKLVTASVAEERLSLRCK